MLWVHLDLERNKNHARLTAKPIERIYKSVSRLDLAYYFIVFIILIIFNL